MSSKIRVVAFGYKVELGEIIINEYEAIEVKQAFAAYRQGSSFFKIAEDLTARKVTYLADKFDWNKNRVKRMLENKNYIGNADMPPLIAEDDFIEVQNLISAKNMGKRETPAELLLLQGKIDCAECGSALKRYLTHKRDAFICKNDQCKTSITLRKLTVAAEKIIAQIKNEETLCPENKKATADSEIEYLQNAFKAELNNPVLDDDKIKSIIFAHALAEYHRTDSGAMASIENEIRNYLDENLDSPIMVLAKIAKAIQITKNKQLVVILKTGKEIREKGD